MLGIYVAGDSGGFLNPAVSFCFCLYRGLPWKRFPIYLVAQFLGGFVAAGVIYANYVNAINNYEGYGIRTVPPSKTATGENPVVVLSSPSTTNPDRSETFADLPSSWSILYLPTSLLE
jgi:aquaglyceroporin related protein